MEGVSIRDFRGQPQKEDGHRLVDYSQTNNRYTQLEVYPLPRVDEMVNEIAGYNVYSTLDLRNAYHRVAIMKEEKPYTTFEAGGRLYEFNRIPFGVINSAASFQRVIGRIIERDGLNGPYAYIDNVTACGKTDEHDKNLKQFTEVVEKYNNTEVVEKYNNTESRQIVTTSGVPSNCWGTP